MCGFCGFTGNVLDRDAYIKEMARLITHRGPDSEGYYLDDGIAMGFRRLSIIDIEAANQPLYNEDKSLVLMFNGEIYNYRQLRDELLAAGHVFVTDGDGEVLVHGFEEWREELLPRLLDWAEKEHTNISLPSLRVDGFSEELANQLNVLRRSGLTFAPEAGTQRLRDAINKNVTEEEILETSRKAFAGGWTAVKLYFMMGLPTETLEDIEGIARLGQQIVNLYYANPDKPKGKGVTVSISASCFVPKPFTPFQWEPQDTMEELRAKQKHLVASVTTKKISLSWHEAETSFLEAVFARGDRRLCAVIEEAYRRGCHLDSWSEHFDFATWMQVFADLGVEPAFYANRRRSYEEILPWDHLDYGVTKAFLKKESEKARQSVTTPNCRQACSGCGAACWKGGVCVENR